MDPGGLPPPPSPRAAPPSSRRAVTVLLAVGVAVLLIAALLAVGARRHRALAEGPRDVQALIRQTQEVRELRAADPIAPEFLTDAQMAEAVREEASEELVTGLPSETVLRTLQVLPEGSSLEEILVEGSAAAVLGFYDPDTKQLVVESRAGTELSPLAQTTLVHEVTHAITDQHFDLARFVAGDLTGDELSASLALIEGDAMLTMERWSLEHFSLGEQFEAGFEAGIGSVGGTSPVAPPVIAEIQIAPYTQGLEFVRALHDEGGWDRVNAAYDVPPTTTEQVLHPAKYLTGEVGENVSPPPAPTGGERVESGELGELFTRAWLSGGAGALLPGVGGDAADGWDGDAYTSWVDEHGTNFASESRWDTAEDAGEFRSAVIRWFGSHFGEPHTTGDRLVADDHCLRIEVDGAAASLELNTDGCR